MRLQGRWPALALAGVLTVLASCSSGGTEPRALPSPRPSSPSASPSLTVEAQVEAAVRRYFDAANQALATGDTRELESLSLPGCGCRKLVAAIHAAFTNGKSVGAHFQLRGIKVHDVRAQSAAATVAFHAAAYADVNHQGTTLHTYPARENMDDVSLVFRGQHWLFSNEVKLR